MKQELRPVDETIASDQCYFPELTIVLHPMVRQKNVCVLRKYTLKYLRAKGHPICNLLSYSTVSLSLSLTHTYIHTHTEANILNVNTWPTWVKSIQELYTFLQLYCKFEITSK